MADEPLSDEQLAQVRRVVQSVRDTELASMLPIQDSVWAHEARAVMVEIAPALLAEVELLRAENRKALDMLQRLAKRFSSEMQAEYGHDIVDELDEAQAILKEHDAR